jgi:sugar lactone lactonase YvrE
MPDLERLIGGVDFGEGPRWHDGALWYSDFYQRAVYRVTPDGDRAAVHADLDDQPSGLGWLPDGRLLVVSMRDRKLLRDEGGALVPHADLSAVATGNANDMVVDGRGNAYVGNFGFDSTPAAGSRPPTSRSSVPTAPSRWRRPGCASPTAR